MSPAEGAVRLPAAAGQGAPARLVRRILRLPLAGRLVLVLAVLLQSRAAPAARARIDRVVARLFGVRPLFDSAWYLQSYPDVAAGRIGPATHYLLRGWREGRDPSPEFSTGRYLAVNPGVTRSRWNPLAHRALVGGLYPAPALPEPTEEHPPVEPAAEAPPPEAVETQPAPPEPVEEPAPAEAPHDYIDDYARCVNWGYLPGRPTVLIVLDDSRTGAAHTLPLVRDLAQTAANVACGWWDGERFCISNIPPTAALALQFPVHMDDAVATFQRLGVSRIEVLLTVGLTEQVGALIDRMAVPYDATFVTGQAFEAEPLSEELAEGRLDRTALLRLVEGAERRVAWGRGLAGKLQEATGLSFTPAYIAEKHRPRRFTVHPRAVRPDEPMRVLLPSAAFRDERASAVVAAAAEEIRRLRAPIQLLVAGPVEAAPPWTARRDQTLLFLGPAEPDLNTVVTTIWPHMAWLPSHDPAALSEFMLQGLPLLAADLVDTAERLENRAHSWVLPASTEPAAWVRTLLELRACGFERPSSRFEGAGLPPLREDFYPREYLSVFKPREMAA